MKHWNLAAQAVKLNFNASEAVQFIVGIGHAPQLRLRRRRGAVSTNRGVPSPSPRGPGLVLRLLFVSFHYGWFAACIEPRNRGLPPDERQRLAGLQ